MTLQEGNDAGLVRQIWAGAIVGLSTVVYSISYGALLFSGPLEGFVAPASWQRTWLDQYFGREKIEVAQRAFEEACREFEEATK